MCIGTGPWLTNEKRDNAMFLYSCCPIQHLAVGITVLGPSRGEAWGQGYRIGLLVVNINRASFGGGGGG